MVAAVAVVSRRAGSPVGLVAFPGRCPDAAVAAHRLDVAVHRPRAGAAPAAAAAAVVAVPRGLDPNRYRSYGVNSPAVTVMGAWTSARRGAG